MTLESQNQIISRSNIFEYQQMYSTHMWVNYHPEYTPNPQNPYKIVTKLPAAWQI